MKKKIISAMAALCLGIGANAQQWGDYTLYSVQNTKLAYLVDTNGNTAHTWSLSSGSTGYSSYMTPGGYLWRTILHSGNSLNGGGMTGEVQKTDYNGNILWDFVYSSSSYCMHHDICPMPNGNVLIISYEVKSSTDLSNAGSSTTHTMWADKIIEVQPTGLNTGTIVWEWHVWDHLVQNVSSTKANYQTSISAHPELMNINYNNTSQTQDWMHVNGVDYNPVTDQIVFSSHLMNEMYVIDHSTTSAEAATHAGGNSGKGGDFLFRWGNLASWGGGTTADFNVVHDAHWIKQGLPRAGQLVGFNNNGVSSSISAVDVFDPPAFTTGMNYAVTAGSPATYSKRYQLSGHAQDMGNSQKLPNGNWLFCIATSGKIYETDSTGATAIWTKTVNGTAPKAFRYDKCWLTDTASSFITPTVTATGNVLSSTQAAYYQWYGNGTLISGATSQSYTPSVDGFYTVQTKSSNNCVMKYSPLYHYTATSGIAKNALNETLSVYPNPSTGMVNFSLVADQVTVYNAFGQVVAQDKRVNAIDLSAFESGMYYISLKSGNETAVKKVSILK